MRFDGDRLEDEAQVCDRPGPGSRFAQHSKGFQCTARLDVVLGRHQAILGAPHVVAMWRTGCCQDPTCADALGNDIPPRDVHPEMAPGQTCRSALSAGARTSSPQAASGRWPPESGHTCLRPPSQGRCHGSPNLIVACQTMGPTAVSHALAPASATPPGFAGSIVMVVTSRPRATGTSRVRTSPSKPRPART